MTLRLDHHDPLCNNFLSSLQALLLVLVFLLHFLANVRLLVAKWEPAVLGRVVHAPPLNLSIRDSKHEAPPARASQQGAHDKSKGVCIGVALCVLRVGEKGGRNVVQEVNSERRNRIRRCVRQHTNSTIQASAVKTRRLTLGVLRISNIPLRRYLRNAGRQRHRARQDNHQDSQRELSDSERTCEVRFEDRVFADFGGEHRDDERRGGNEGGGLQDEPAGGDYVRVSWVFKNGIEGLGTYGSCCSSRLP